MKGWLQIVGLGVGLSIGGGLIYLFAVNEIFAIIFLALVMFVLGGTVMGLALLFQNRQWIRAVFGDGQPPRINNNFRMAPPYPSNSFPANAPQGYLPEPNPYEFQIIENQQAANALNDDSPMA